MTIPLQALRLAQSLSLARLEHGQYSGLYDLGDRPGLFYGGDQLIF